MTTFYCPSCWTAMGKDSPQCPRCGCDIREYLEEASYLRRLIEALDHPDPTTRTRVAYILGRRKDREAVLPLAEKVRASADLYLCLTCLEALQRIGDGPAMEALRSFREDGRPLIAAKAIALLNEKA